MNNLLMLPVILPFAVGALLILLVRYRKTQRIISALTSFAMLGIAIFLAYEAYTTGVMTLEFGNWTAHSG